MVDFDNTVGSALATVLSNTQYELFCDSSTTLPAITFAEYSHYQNYKGDTIGYSHIEYMVKVWANTIADIRQYSASVDAAMRGLGFTRTSATELVVDDKIVKNMVYSGTIYEEFSINTQGE